MHHESGNMLSSYNSNEYFLITTNGMVCNTGLVMGAGIALDAKKMFPDLPRAAANSLPYGYGPHYYGTILLRGNIVLFQTKMNWKDLSSYDLISRSLDKFSNEFDKSKTYHVPPLGCGHGGLDKKVVLSMIEKKLEGWNLILWNFT